MLHILWLILKWILILLGILIGLVLLLLLLILFARSDTEQVQKKRTEGIRKIRASGEVSWLLHIISARAFWEEGKIQTKICVFGVPLSRLKQNFPERRKTKTDTSKRSFCSEEADRTGKIFQII